MNTASDLLALLGLEAEEVAQLTAEARVDITNDPHGPERCTLCRAAIPSGTDHFRHGFDVPTGRGTVPVTWPYCRGCAPAILEAARGGAR